MGFYLPAILTFLAIPITPFLPQKYVEAGLGFVLVVGLLMSITGSLIFLVKWFRAPPTERRECSLTLIVSAIVISIGISLMADGGLLPGEPELWNLMFGLEPFILAWALTRKSQFKNEATIERGEIHVLQ